MKIEGTAAVTGAGSGIGLGTALALARRGFDVLAMILLEEQREEILAAAPDVADKILVKVVDITDPGDFAFPRDLSILVNNAGIRRATLPIEESGPDEWRAVMDVNFFALVEMSRMAIPIMRTAGRGVICNVASNTILKPGIFTAPYRASKGAVDLFTESLRVEVEQFNIRVIEVLPSNTASNINLDSPSRYPAAAINYPHYRRMAELLHEYNQRTVPTPNTREAAGEAIADAIMDDGGPLRYGTDARSRAALERGRHVSDEELLQERLEIFAELRPPTRLSARLANHRHRRWHGARTRRVCLLHDSAGNRPEIRVPARRAAGP
jgi:NAD(P)-dependent dehydrogenase (short-subunit alcohol dehydrogenase family)